MGLLSDIFDLLSSFEDSTYIEDAKEWGDKIWKSLSNKESATLSLYEIDNRLYKRMRIVFYSGNISIFTNERDNGWNYFEKRLTRGQKNQLRDQGYIVIKRYK